MSELIRDPVEQIIADALYRAGISYVSATQDNAQTLGLDFYIPSLAVHIECKQFHTARIGEHMARAPNVIVIQGIGAAQAFARMILSGYEDLN